MTFASAPAPCARPAVLAVFRNGAAQITGDPRFVRHQRTDNTIDFDAVLAEPGWSNGQRALIRLAAALSGNQNLPPDALSAHLTGRQIDLVLEMCHAAHPKPGHASIHAGQQA